MPRIRLIAGPNGSGKTTLFSTLQEHKDVHFGQYINPDDLQLKLSLTYESVMSHKSHLEYIQRGRDAGFKTYLYYVCINDPLVNIARVKERVSSGGHNVPQEKIISRYNNSLSHLYDMSVLCDRVYYFDNSNEQELFAEKSENNLLKIKVDKYNKIQPVWFQDHVLSKWEQTKIRY